jgi:2-oxoglutarate dehydrogenase E1 component
VFGEFKEVMGRDSLEENIYNYRGDVKYHMGTHHMINFDDGEKMHISLLSNPSHLEVINPVIIGSAKAR